MKTENIIGEGKIRKVIFNEVTLVLALVSIISGCIFWVTNPQTDLQIRIVKLETQLESNQTITAALEQIKQNDFVEIHKELDDINTKQVSILQSLAAINQQLSTLNK